MRPILDFSVPADHPCLAGHFPGRPIVPGVLLLDAALTAIAADLGLAAPMRLVRVKFMSPVLPEQAVSVLVGAPEAGSLAFACASGTRPVLAATARFAAASP